MTNRLNTTDISPRTALLSIVILVLVTVGGVTLLMKYINGAPAERHVDHQPRSRVPAVTEAPPPALVTARAMAPNYAVIVSRNLFRAPVKAVDIVPTPADRLPGLGDNTGKAPFGGPVSIAPFADGAITPAAETPKLAFTGMVEIGDTSYALLEDLTQDATQYTRVGSSAFGYKLVAMTDRYATVEQNGRTQTLAIGENKKEPEPPKPPETPQPAAGAQPQGAPNGQPANATPPEGQNGFQGRGRFNRERMSRQGQEG